MHVNIALSSLRDSYVCSHFFWEDKKNGESKRHQHYLDIPLECYGFDSYICSHFFVFLFEVRISFLLTSLYLYPAATSTMPMVMPPPITSFFLPSGCQEIFKIIFKNSIEASCVSFSWKCQPLIPFKYTYPFCVVHSMRKQLYPLPPFKWLLC